MAGQQQPPRSQRPKGRSPAERAEEFSAAQQKLKQEAADRREAAGKAAEERDASRQRRG
jgi:hypothetical protein